MRPLAAVLAVSFCFLPTPVSSQPSSAGKPTIIVPVVVRDQAGAEVTDLPMTSFEILDKGKPQTISAFEPISLGGSDPGGQQAPRFTAYLLDDLRLPNPGDFNQMIVATERHLAKTTPDERVSIYTTSCSAALVEWTNDTDRIQQFLHKLSPHVSGPGICRVARFEVLNLTLTKALIERMKVLPGLRGIVMVSPGYAYYHQLELQEAVVIDLANQAHIIIMGVYVTPSPPVPVGLTTDGFSDLCDGTGGSQIYTGNDLAAGFQKLRLPRYVYMFSMSLDNVKHDGSVHQLKVIVKDPRKLTVQARKKYTAPKD
jgi:VWFA-related protein